MSTQSDTPAEPSPETPKRDSKTPRKRRRKRRKSKRLTPEQKARREKRLANSKEAELRRTAELDQRLERDRQIWNNRLHGMTNSAIAKALKIPTTVVADCLKRWREDAIQFNQDAAEVEKSIRVARTDTNSQMLMNIIVGSLDAVTKRPTLPASELTRIMETIRANDDFVCKLMGYNAPTEIVQRTGQATPQEANRLIAEEFGRVTPADAAKLVRSEVEPAGEPSASEPTAAPAKE
jgi:restriction endonuclease